MSIKCFLIILFCSVAWATKGCQSQRDQTVCTSMELTVDRPILAYQSGSSEIVLESVGGSLGAKTLLSFPEARSLIFISSDLDYIEDGAICSLPELRWIMFKDNRKPSVLTRGILRGCDEIERFETNSAIEPDALHELTGLQYLDLWGPVTSSFNKAYLEPLTYLRTLHLEIDNLDRIDSGLYCSSPMIEEIELLIRSEQPVTEAPFKGCHSLKKVYIGDSKIAEGENPFRNLPHLIEMTLSETHVAHLTKDFLSGLQNLKTLVLTSDGPIRIDGDAFTEVPNLTKLEIRGYNLQNFHFETLYPLLELVVLNIASNQIKNLDSLPTLPNLEELILDFNFIQKLDLEGLKRKAPKLKILKLEGNPTLPEFEEELKKEESIAVILGQSLLDPGFNIAL